MPMASIKPDEPPLSTGGRGAQLRGEATLLLDLLRLEEEAERKRVFDIPSSLGDWPTRLPGLTDSLS